MKKLFIISAIILPTTYIAYYIGKGVAFATSYDFYEKAFADYEDYIRKNFIKKGDNYE